MRISFTIILTLFIQILYAQSVLNKNGMIKVATSTEGVYKIDSQFLEAAGENPSEINPNKIQVYGMPGGHIPQSNSIDYPYDPQPLAIKVKANTNAVFEENEAVYFYADAVDNIDYNFENEFYEYSNNVYSDSIYFFIDINAEQTNSIASISSENINVDQSFNWYDAVYFHEVDEVNILRSGRKWFGESFSINRTQDFTFELNNDIASSDEISLATHYLAQTYNEANLKIRLNEYELASESLERVSDFTIFPYREKGKLLENRSTIASSLVSGLELNISLTHEALGAGRSDGYLDYLFLTVPQKLNVLNSQIVIRNRGFQQIGNYELKIGNLSNDHYVWEVSDPINSKELIMNNGSFKFSQTEEKRERKFITFNANSALSPKYIATINSQNLKKSTSPDYLVITFDGFNESAQKLASYRENHNNFSVEVAKISEIFNEFGSGRRDVSAIRNYIRYYYLKNPDNLKYVLLLGASSYDFKDRIANNTNLVPVYQSRNSLHPVFTYASDDFYGFMNQNEGFWAEESNNIDELDLGIGRIPAKTKKEAADAVNKIIYYETNPQAFNKWRNDIYFIADDEDGNIFHRDSEELSKYVIDNFGFYNINKLYLGAFEQEVFASTQRSPKMREAINDMANKGALIVNYIGHGSESSWTNESILNVSMVEEWNNIDKLPLFVTATCEFGRFDNPNIESGAQRMLLKPDGGAIALLTTSRPVESSSNATLNRSFFQHVFKSQNTKPKKLGDIIRQTKNSGIVGVKNRNFILLGDPAVTLAEPESNVQITNIMNEEGETDTLKSMSKITVSGLIENNLKQIMSDFDGELTIELYDKPQATSTIDKAESEFNFMTFDQVIYRGKSSIQNGEFSFSFYVPTEIDYRIDKGKFSFYAKNDNQLEDASGFNNDFIVGGSSLMSNNDTAGPDLALYLNDREFENGNRVGNDATLIVDLFDEHGISISNSNVNPGITYSIDGGEDIKLNDFFYYDKDSYQEGTIEYNLQNLKEGNHYITIKASDVYNNKSQATIEFEVIGEDDIELLDFAIYPNPAQSNVNIRLRQNRKNAQVMVQYQIINNQGQLVYSHEYTTNEDFRIDQWDLRNQNGEKLSPGLYFVRLFVRSVEDNAKTDQIKKLIIIN